MQLILIVSAAVLGAMGALLFFDGNMYAEVLGAIIGGCVGYAISTWARRKKV